MRNKRILIVEPEVDFALQMAAVLHQDGFATTLAHTAQEATREVEERRPDLVVLRAELPEQNGFSLCARLRRDPALAGLPIVITSSDSSPEALAEHAAHPTHAASAYLPMPFAMDDSRATVAFLAPAADEPEEVEADSLVEIEPSETVVGEGLATDGGDAGAEAAGTEGWGTEEAAGAAGAAEDDLGADLEQALRDGPIASAPAAPEPPPPPPAPQRPPRLPRRERRSAITEDNRLFLERTFGTIAERKAELLTEARAGMRRSGVRRDLLGTPEGKLQLLREELRMREAQIARLSEIGRSASGSWPRWTTGSTRRRWRSRR